MKFSSGKQSLKWEGKYETDTWSLMAVYNREGWKELDGELKWQMGNEEDRRESIWIVMGDSDLLFQFKNWKRR